MEILGTHFVLTLGIWRLRFVLSIEETDEVPARASTPSHHVSVIKDSNNVRSAQK